MPRDLTDKVIVITGASAGIGAATAVEAARAGMHAVLAARRADRLEAVAERVREARREALVAVTDVADPAQVDALVRQTLERFDRIDVMFANAGYGAIIPFGEMSSAEHRRIFDVNYFGTVHCVRAVLPAMRKQGGGHIVITSSIVGRVGLPYNAAYSATKSAQATLAMGLRHELDVENIDVTTVYPVSTRTEFFDVAVEAAGRGAPREDTPAHLMQSGEQVARRVVDALRRPRAEVWPARWAGWASGLALLMGPLTRRALRRHADRDRRLLTGRAANG
jgi:short-subunit dehydrogenase